MMLLEEITVKIPGCSRGAGKGILVLAGYEPGIPSKNFRHRCKSARRAGIPLGETEVCPAPGECHRRWAENQTLSLENG